MIKIVDEIFLDNESKYNFIFNIVNANENINSLTWKKLKDLYPHVGIQYRKYLNYCKKNKINPMGTCQYIPREFWAIGLVDTMNNNDVYNYDEPYQFIVNAFIDKSNKGIPQIDIEYLYSALKDLRSKTKFLKPQVVIPYGTLFVGHSAKWKQQWEKIDLAIHNVLGIVEDIDVVLCKNIK